MALRAVRGLLRLWLFLSVLWIGSIGVMVWASHPADFWIIPAANPFDQFDKKSPDDFDPHEFAVFKRKEEIKVGAKLALVPPILVLAIGSGFLWVVRGFR